VLRALEQVRPTNHHHSLLALPSFRSPSLNICRAFTLRREKLTCEQAPLLLVFRLGFAAPFRQVAGSPFSQVRVQVVTMWRWSVQCRVSVDYRGRH